jgi:hypothetical protein
MSYEFHDFACPDLGKELLKDAKGELPIDVWRHYVLNHDPHPHRAGTMWSPPSVIGYCDEDSGITLDPQKAVDDAYGILVDVFFATRKLSYTELQKGSWDAISVLHQAHSSRRKRGQPKSMQSQAVRAWVIRKFNPHPTKQGESSVSWASLADKLLLKNGKCPRSIHDDDGRPKICGVSRHQYNDPCVKALTTAVGNLQSAMKRDGIPL